MGTILFLQELKKGPKYKKICKILVAASTLSLLGFQGTLYSKLFIVVCIPTFSLGFFIVPAIPIILELANEVCFPIGEAVITGFIYSFSHIMGFILGSIFSFILNS